MIYITVSFPVDYANGNKIFLKDLMTESEGVQLSLYLMRNIIDTQVH